MSTQSTTPTPSTPTPAATQAATPAKDDAQSTLITNNPISAETQQQQPSEQEQQTFEQALAEVKRLTAIRDKLIKQQEAANKEIERIQKRTRLEELKVLVPPELFSRSDYYEAELEKVYNYKNVPDETIRELYQHRMRMIDEGHRNRNNSNKGVKQHSASSSGSFHTIFDNFRDVPQFKEMASSASLQANKSNSDKIRNLMKRIAASNGSGSTTRVE